jgi:hypothetical protein
MRRFGFRRALRSSSTRLAQNVSGDFCVESSVRRGQLDVFGKRVTATLDLPHQQSSEHRSSLTAKWESADPGTLRA